MRAMKVMYSDGTMVNLEMTVAEYNVLRDMMYYSYFQQEAHFKTEERAMIALNLPTIHEMET